MKKILTFLGLLVIFVFQTTIGQYIKFFGILPNYVLIFSVLYAVSNGYSKAAVIGFLSGIMLDMTNNNVFFGMSALIIMYISLGVSYLSNRFFYDSILLSVIFVAFAGFTYEFLFVFFTRCIFGYISVSHAVFRYILPAMLVNSLLSIVMRILIKWLKNEYIRGI